MWIGTANGLDFLSKNYLETDNKRFIPILQDNRATSLSYNDIICLYEDSENTIWVGTYGGGINQFIGTRDGRNFDFVQLTTDNGLSSNLILSFVEDKSYNFV